MPTSFPHMTGVGTAQSGQNSGRNGVEAKSEQGTNANNFLLGWRILSINCSHKLLTHHAALRLRVQKRPLEEFGWMAPVAEPQPVLRPTAFFEVKGKISVDTALGRFILILIR